MSKKFRIGVALLVLVATATLAILGLNASWLGSSPVTGLKVFVVCSVASLHLVDANERHYSWLLLREWWRDPRREANAAISANDRLLLGVAGVGLFFPGSPNTFQLPPGYRFEEILGVGDYSAGMAASMYQDLSYEHALVFNRLVLAHFEPRRNRTQAVRSPANVLVDGP